VLVVSITHDVYRTYAQDGDVHMTYYVSDEQLSFVWDMHARHPIEVEHGGYGEPLRALLKLDEADLPDVIPSTPHGWARWFMTVCEAAVPLLA
jgi:hypothetical protein